MRGLDYVRKDDKKNNSKASLLFSIFGLLEFCLIYAACILIMSFLSGLVLTVPVLGTLSEWLLQAKGDTPGVFARAAAVTLAYFGTVDTMDRILKKTCNKTVMLVGIYLIALTILAFMYSAFIVLSAISIWEMFSIAIIIIAGVIMFLRGKKNAKTKEDKPL